VAANGHRVINGAVHRAAMVLGRGDAIRGLSIGFAAFLTIAGAAVPHLPTLAMTALLFLAGATLVLFAALPISTPDLALKFEDAAAPANDMQRVAITSLQELLQRQRTPCATDRAAFARLTAHMSHELRTPLNAIIGFSELMSNEVFGPLGSSSYAAYARDIHASGLSLLKSADDALAITALLTSTDEQHRSAQTNAALVATEALSFHAHAFAARGVQSCCTIDCDAEIMADPQAVRQLLINLIADVSANAGAGTDVALTSRLDGSEIELSVSASGATAEGTAEPERFSLLLARTLAELCGAKLHISHRHIAVRFPRAQQNDFFGPARRAA
jgi:two-component system cell cycle sensor histidine kinase PleC